LHPEQIMVLHFEPTSLNWVHEDESGFCIWCSPGYTYYL